MIGRAIRRRALCVFDTRVRRFVYCDYMAD
jgi:hypothetical protein